MKIAMFNNFFQGTGYSQAAIRNVQSLLSVGVKVAIRNIWLNNPTPADIERGRNECPPDVLACESENLSGIDYTIHHTLPHLASPCEKSKNILAFAYETNHMRMSDWPQLCNNQKFDSILTFCKQAAQAIRDSGVTTKINIVPHAIDLNAKNNPKLQHILDQNICNLVFVGEFSVRKNISGLLRAYFSEFTPDDNINLVIKTFVSGRSPEESEKIVLQEIENIKSGCKLKYFPPIVVVTSQLSSLQMHCLSYSTTYSINVSMGEAFGYWPFECLVFNKPFIVSDSFAYNQYLPQYKNTAGFHVSTEPDIVWNAGGGFDNIYTSKEIWNRPNLVNLKSCMRSAYDIWKNRQDKYNMLCVNAGKLADKFSFENVGKMLLGILEK